jgi:hypothetical protein
MATTLLTLQTLQDQIHTNYTGANDTPAVGSTDWLIRLNHINRIIHEWSSQKGVEWNQLWTTGNPTPSVIANADTTYPLPADYKRMGGYIRIVLPNGSKQPIKVIKQMAAQKAIANGEQKVYVTGKPGSYVLNLTWTPVTGDAYTGSTIEFDYYKYPLALSSAADVPEMSDPFYIVESVTAKLFQTQSPTNYNIHNNMAIDLLQQMMEENETADTEAGSSNSISVTLGA